MQDRIPTSDDWGQENPYESPPLVDGGLVEDGKESRLFPKRCGKVTKIVLITLAALCTALAADSMFFNKVIPRGDTKRNAPVTRTAFGDGPSGGSRDLLRTEEGVKELDSRRRFDPKYIFKQRFARDD